MAAGFSLGSIIGYLQIDGAAKADEDVLRVQSSLNLAATAAERMGVATGETEVALTGAGRAASLASASSGKLRAAQLSVIAAQERYNLLLTDGEASTARLATAEATLIRANERLTATATPAAGAIAKMTVAEDGAAAGAGRMSAGLGGVLETAAKLGLAIGAFEALKTSIDLIKGGAEFQKQMLMIQTNANASADEVRNMSTALLGLAGEVATGPTELATSLYHVEQNGLRGAAALDVVKIAAEGAKVGNADLEATTNSMTAAVASGIPGVKNLDQAMGALIATVGTGDMKMSDLNEALGSGLLAVVKGYGLSLADVGAALAVFGDNNIRGADAATALRMAVQSMTKPAASGKKALEELGLSSTTLATDMQTGGLNKAVLDLNAHLISSGNTGVKMGQILTEAFGKKAGVGLSVLMGQVDRLETKYGELADSSDNFAGKWDATTKTASFAFKRLGTEAEVAGVQIFEKLQQPITDAANWLATSLPNAIGKTQHALEPLEQEVGALLVPAWKVLSDILGTVSGALGDVGDALSGQGNAITIAGTAVLGMWVAWKGYTIVSSAVKAVASAIETIQLKAMYAGEAITGMASMSTLALGGIGIALGAASFLWLKHQQAVQNAKKAVQDYTTAIEADSGALGENTRKQAESALQSSGAFDAARKLGINLKTLTDAVLGNADATASVKKQTDGLLGSLKPASDAYGSVAAGASTGSDKLDALANAADKVNGVLGDQTGILGQAVAAAKNNAEADGKNADSIGKLTDNVNANATALQFVVDTDGNLVEAQVAVSTATDGSASSMAKAKTASDLLKDSLDALNGIAVGVEQTQDALSLSLLKLKDKSSLAKDANNNMSTSLDQTTQSGIQNRQMLTDLIQSANDHAEAVANQKAATDGMTAGLQAGAAMLKTDEDRIRTNAAAAGLNKSQVDGLIASLGKIPTVTKSDINVDTTTALKNVHDLFDSIPSAVTISLQLNAQNFGQAVHDAVNSIPDTVSPTAAKPLPGHSWGGTLAAGWNEVGELGTELVNGTTGEVQNHNQATNTLAKLQDTRPININVYPSAGMDEGALATKVALKLPRGI